MTAKVQPPSHTAAVNGHGPVGVLFGVLVGAVMATAFSWVFSIIIEVVGMNTIWKDTGVFHARQLVLDDLRYIENAPHSVIVPDTVAFARDMASYVALPFVKLGVVGLYERAHSTAAGPAATAGKKLAAPAALSGLSAWMTRMWSLLGMIALYTAQDTALRLAIVVLALPAFVLACLLGAVDGLVRRDLRKWGGGRESSFVYHHAKATTYLSLGGGFSLYLSWPGGGFNPAHMVLVFTVLVAWGLSLTLSSFKKYL